MRVEGLGFRACQLIKAALVTSAPSPPLPPLARNLLARATPDKTRAALFMGVWGRVGGPHFVMYLGQLGFHSLSTPTPPAEGWGRQNVETGLVNSWTGVEREAIRIRTL